MIWRECVSSYMAFSADSVEAGEYALDNTSQDAVFITGTQHLNPVLSIAGRSIVCGPDLWLYYHGFDTWERNQDLEAFYEDPKANSHVPAKYGAEYVFVSSYELSSYNVDEEGLEALGEKVFENSEACIYKLVSGKTE